MIAELACVNHPSEPAAVVALYGGDQLGAAYCGGCATCTDTRCDELGAILDTERNEPWCAPHTAQQDGGDAVSGPDLVPVGSGRHLDALAALRRQRGGRR